jgi:hypothetical protein
MRPIKQEVKKKVVVRKKKLSSKCLLDGLEGLLQAFFWVSAQYFKRPSCTFQ